MDYNLLKERIKELGDKALPILKNEEVKEQIIHGTKKYDFIWFAQEMSDSVMLTLLDEKGLEIFHTTSDIQDKLNGILTCGKNYVNALLKKPNFCHMVMESIDFLKDYLYGIKGEGALAFVQYVQETYPDKLESIFLHLSVKTQLEVVTSISLPIDLTKAIITRGGREASAYLLKNDLRITTLTDIEYSYLLNMAKRGVQFPPHLLNDREFVTKMMSTESVKAYRFLMRALETENDVSVIENNRKRFYNKELATFVKKENMLKRYYQCYQSLCKSMDNHLEITISDVMDQYFSFYGDYSTQYEIGIALRNYYYQNDKAGLHSFLEKESHLQLTNMVIDYHFEDIPYNFFLDLKQLIQFQEGEGKTLTSSEIEMYSKLLNLDKLSYEMVMSLHEELKKSPMMEVYYDHFRGAKDKSMDLLEEMILNETSVQKYKDQNLSLKSGVDIYVLDGEEYYAFVKSTPFSKEELLTPNHLRYVFDGGSYSIDGSSKLNTYKNPKDYYNFIYSSFPKEQLVHMYPVDSFTNYQRDANYKPTTRVHELYTPKKFVEASLQYNELLFSLPNIHRKDELNSQLKKPTLLGLYCYDEITEKDIISAKNMGVGIVLVKTKSYQKPTTENKINMFDTTLTMDTGWKKGYDYLTNVETNDMAERRK